MSACYLKGATKLQFASLEARHKSELRASSPDYPGGLALTHQQSLFLLLGTHDLIGLANSDKRLAERVEEFSLAVRFD